jgi:hypothetical protein
MQTDGNTEMDKLRLGKEKKRANIVGSAVST